MPVTTTSCRCPESPSSDSRGRSYDERDCRRRPLKHCACPIVHYGPYFTGGYSRAWFTGWRRFAIAALVLAALGGTLVMLELSSPSMATALGEQVDSVRRRFDGRAQLALQDPREVFELERDVELPKAQALFHVAHDTPVLSSSPWVLRAYVQWVPSLMCTSAQTGPSLRSWRGASPSIRPLEICRRKPRAMLRRFLR